MSDFFKKALGVFVEFDETPAQADDNKAQHSAEQPVKMQQAEYRGVMTPKDIEKFTKHFNDVFDKANLDGPDYYEFSKMMTLLEEPIPDEKTRIVSVFASLSLQGLTKTKVIETAKQYISILETDKIQFEKAAAEKVNQDVEDRKKKVDALEKKILDNTEMIKKLTQENTEAQAMIGTLKNEIVQLDTTIAANKGSYIVAFQAMYNKISGDIQQFNSLLK